MVLSSDVKVVSIEDCSVEVTGLLDVSEASVEDDSMSEVTVT